MGILRELDENGCAVLHNLWDMTAWQHDENMIVSTIIASAIILEIIWCWDHSGVTHLVPSPIIVVSGSLVDFILQRIVLNRNVRSDECG